jgi:hypothetical protein
MHIRFYIGLYLACVVMYCVALSRKKLVIERSQGQGILPANVMGQSPSESNNL